MKVKWPVRPMMICPRFLASDVPVRPARPVPEALPSMEQNAFSGDHIFERLHPFMARPASSLNLREFLRVPPAAANDDAFGHDPAVADQMFADDVDIVELAFRNRNQGGVPDAAGLKAAEFGTAQRHR